MSKRNNASKVIDAKKEEIVNVPASINLQKFAKELEGKGISHLRNERETIYIYPSEWKSDDINGKKGRQFRNHKRSFVKRLSDNLFFLGKGEKIEEMKAEIEKFDAFYKEFYKINDYSLKSLSSSNDPAKNQNIDLMLRIIAEIKSI